MRKMLKSLALAAGIILSGSALANAATVSLQIANSSPEYISFYGAPTCTNCTTTTAAIINSGSSGTSTATIVAGDTSMTYSIGYYGTYTVGTNHFVQKGCRATITVSVAADGTVTNATGGWVPFVGNPTCSTVSSPQIVGSTVIWSVRLNATNQP